MKILITGAGGFIGRNLSEQLKGKYECHVPSSAELDLSDGNQVSAYLKSNLFDIIIHAATWNATRNSPKDTSKVLSHNLRMFFNLARASSYYGKMIYYGSGSEYDRAHWVPKMKEEYFDTHLPCDEYGFSKYVMNAYTRLQKNIYNLRVFGVFGKYEDWEIRFISNACCKAIHDLPITIKQNVFFDYMHIDDLVAITEWCMRHEAKEKAYNVCSGATHDLVTLAKKILSSCGKNLDIVVATQGLGVEYSGDNTKLLSEMGTYAFSDMDESIRALYQWYLSKKSDIDKELLRSDK